MFEAIPINDQTWLICGGRNFSNEEMFNSAMGDLIRLRGMPRRIIQGGARGTDTFAIKWAARHALEICTVEADWLTRGKAAGPMRNAKMLGHNPHLVVAFPGGLGTADMVRRSRKAGVDVAEIDALGKEGA